MKKKNKILKLCLILSFISLCVNLLTYSTVEAVDTTPTVTTNDVTGVESYNVTLQGSLNDNGNLSTVVWFEYDTSLSFSYSTGYLSLIPPLFTENKTISDPYQDGVAYKQGSNYFKDTGANWVYASAPGNIYRGFVEWLIPYFHNSTIFNNLSLIYHGSGNNGDCHIHECVGNRPSTANAQDLWNELGEGTEYANESGFPVVAANQQLNFNDNATSDFANQTTWFAIGMQKDVETGGSSSFYSENYGSPDPAPTLSINFSHYKNFQKNLTGLSPGTLYYYRAVANNSINTSYGSNKSFLTRPLAPANLTANPAAYRVYLTWSKGSGANTTCVVRKTSSYPVNVTDGLVVYNSTDSSYFDNNSINASTKYYYKAWSYSEWGSLNIYSSNNDTANVTSYNDTIPPTIKVNVTADTGFSPSGLGYINVSGSDNNGSTIIINITVNSEYFNETISNPGKTATYSFNLSSNGSNMVYVVATDTAGNTYNYSDIVTIYFVNISFINERNGTDFNWNYAKTVGSMTGCNLSIPSKEIFLDIYADENSSLEYISLTKDVIRITSTYTNVTDPIIRSFSIDLLDSISKIGLVEVETQFYEQLIYSTGEKPIVVKNVYSDSFILADYTAYTYGSTYSASAYTINMLYYLYTYSNGSRILLSSIEGSRAAQVNLDFLDYANTTYDFTILGEDVSISRYTNTTWQFFYKNLKEDNEKLELSIYDGDAKIFYFIETDNPDEATVYFNYATLYLVNDRLTLKIISTKTDGSTNTITRIFSVTSGQISEIPPEVAAVLAISMALFGFTFVATKYVFGFFGIFAIIIGLALTAFTEQVWYISLIQAVLVILLAFIILIFKDEYSAVV
jgi:hypothetical protein